MAEVRIPATQRVEKVARAIQVFTREELAQLVSLVPQLREVEPSREVKETAAEYFQREILSRRGGEPLGLDEPFIGGLTYGEYVGLSEEDEAAFWDDLFAEEEMEIDDFQEYDVRPDARLPARQERSA